MKPSLFAHQFFFFSSFLYLQQRAGRQRRLQLYELKTAEMTAHTTKKIQISTVHAQTVSLKRSSYLLSVPDKVACTGISDSDQHQTFFNQFLKCFKLFWKIVIDLVPPLTHLVVLSSRYVFMVKYLLGVPGIAPAGNH